MKTLGTLKRILMLPFVIPAMGVAAIITNSFTNHEDEPFWPTIWRWVKTGQWS